VETNAFVYPEAIKARKFVNGLLPDLYVTVKPHNDQTWNAAVDRAKAYELTHKDQHAVNAYLNKFASTGTNTQTEDLCKVIQELTKHVQQLSTGNRGYQNNNNNNQRGASQSSAQAQQNPNVANRVICYSCGQPGHIVRNCSNQNNNVAPPNDNTNGNNGSSTNSNNRTAPRTNNLSEEIAQIHQMLAQLVSQEESLN
jgi:hypothetical protein